MKIYFTLVIILFSYFFCYGQVDTTEVPFVAYWSKGDSYNFKVTKIKKRWKEESLVKNDTSSYIVNFEVIDSTETNYKVKWSYKNTLSEFNIPPALREEFSQYTNTELIYTTTEFGAFIGIENWEEIAKTMKEMFADIIEFLADDGKANKEKLAEAMNPLLKVYESKEGIEQLVFKELYYFHFPFGAAFPTAEPIVYEEKLPNMFGGDPIRGDAKIYFDSIDFENKTCVFIQEMKLNPNDTKAIVTDIFKQTNLNDEETKRAMKAAKFDMQDYNKYEYDYYPGIPRKIETKRELLIDMRGENAKTIEVVRIELLEDSTSTQSMIETEDIQSSPKLVLQEVFRAAKEQDYSKLHKLCPPNKKNDGDTQKYICDIASSSKKEINEFIGYFKNARITGETTYSTSSDGTVMAKVPFYFNHPQGESRSNETMNMLKIDGKWYLESF